jgi:hypothetical protein
MENTDNQYFIGVCRRLYGDKIYAGPLPQEWIDAMKETKDTGSISRFLIGEYVRLEASPEVLAPIYTEEEMHENDYSIVWINGPNGTNGTTTIPTTSNYTDFKCPQCNTALFMSFSWGIVHGEGFCTCGLYIQHYWYPSHETPKGYSPRPPILIWGIAGIPDKFLTKEEKDHYKLVKGE